MNEKWKDKDALKYGVYEQTQAERMRKNWPMSRVGKYDLNQIYDSSFQGRIFMIVSRLG